MVALAIPAEQQALADEVRKALERRGDRPCETVLEELGVADLLVGGGTLFDAAMVAEAAGRHGLVPYRDERILVAASCIGMATRALEDAAQYARERIVFGRPIGEYQGVSHALAQAITEVEGTRLLIWRAIAARGEGSADAAKLDAFAWWWATQACMRAIRAAMRTFGGYGVSEDSPLPSLFRAAQAALLADGDPDLALASLPQGGLEASPAPISFAMDEEAVEWADRTRRFLAENFTEDSKQAFSNSDDNHLPDLHRKLAAAGLLYPEWPVEWGGSGVGPWAASAVHRELSLAGWPISVMQVSDTIGKLIMRFATDEAKQEILPRLSRGEVVACLGMSEPSGGSDVFGAKTRATHGADGWVINGQKIFTTSAHVADYVLLLTRTEGGLSLFMAPMGDAVDMAPVHTFAGERTNITYYSDFAVADRYLLGEADKGVKVLAATLTLEHSAGDYFLGAMLAVQRELAQALPDLLTLPGMADNERSIRLSVAKLDAHIAMHECLSWRAIWASAENAAQRWYGPMSKLFGSESWEACCTELTRRFAPHSLSGKHPVLSLVEREARSGLQATIYGGTSEIQRSIIAETALGLPRSR
jgi:alkylation response protein AidB-like acyl-CoA dehydrogenase